MGPRNSKDEKGKVHSPEACLSKIGEKAVGESNLSKFNTLLLVVVLVLLLWNVFWRPQRNGRFHGVGDNALTALDTKTGQLCRTVGLPAKTPVPPLCSELK
jgi:hypothetical protein